MTGDNRDRYGHRHRQDSDYELGESKPGDVGDSDGTYHDRARKNENVIVDGQVRSRDAHERSSVEASSGQSESATSASGSQSELDGKVVEVTIESTSGTRDTMAHYDGHQVHIEGGTPGETIRVRLEGANGYMIGERVSVRE